MPIVIDLTNSFRYNVINYFICISQSVYDQTIPIVGAQLLFTVGVTCALAFELPSEPIYKITQKLRNNLLGIKDDSSSSSSEEESGDATAGNDTDDDNSRIDYNHNKLHYINYNKNNYYDSMNKHGYYYASNYNNNNKYYRKPLSPNYHISDKSDNYDNILFNQSSIFVTPKPLNQTTSVWTSLVKK